MQCSYQRHLPHQVPKGFPLCLTWNLKGALPREVLQGLAQQRERLEREPRRAGESAKDRRIRHDKIVFALADRYLDGTDQGPLSVADPAAAAVVEEALWFGVPERYRLFAWCVIRAKASKRMGQRSKVSPRRRSKAA